MALRGTRSTGTVQPGVKGLGHVLAAVHLLVGGLSNLASRHQAWMRVTFSEPPVFAQHATAHDTRPHPSPQSCQPNQAHSGPARATQRRGISCGQVSPSRSLLDSSAVFLGRATRARRNRRRRAAVPLQTSDTIHSQTRSPQARAATAVRGRTTTGLPESSSAGSLGL